MCHWICFRRLSWCFRRYRHVFLLKITLIFFSSNHNMLILIQYIWRFFYFYKIPSRHYLVNFNKNAFFVGVLGSISFPFLRKKLGLTRTGLVGMCLLVTTLTICLVSIWVEGSPFQPDYFTAAANTTSNSDQGKLLRAIGNKTIGRLDREFQFVYICSLFSNTKFKGNMSRSFLQRQKVRQRISVM